MIVKSPIVRSLPIIHVSRFYLSEVCEKKMKVQNIDILLSYIATISILQSYSDAMENMQFESDDDDIDDTGFKIIEAAKNMISRPEFKIYLSVNTRESSSMMNFALPVDKNNQLLIKQNLNLKKTLVFLIHGYLSDGNAKWMKKLSAAYLKRRDAIVFIVDWGTGAITLNYDHSVQKTTSVAIELAEFMDLLTEQLGANASNIHIIGHSLGAHIAGFVGKAIPHVNRITGLDPANPGFTISSPRLSKGDAKQVDVVHTNAILGSYDLLGDVDFYVNGGETQPGCKPAMKHENIIDMVVKNVCSHHRAITYFIESIDKPNCKFVASNTMEQAKKVQSKIFDPKQNTVLGLDTFKYNSLGKHYIITNDRSPYCRS